MKDEDMAEEYARKTLSKDCCDLKLEVYKKTIKAFLAGLKAGRPQWHKVADGDLPPDRYTVLSDKGTLVLIKDKRWYEYSPNYDNILLKTWEEPKYWCEKTQFKE